MPSELVSISTDQVMAFVELARTGSLRLAAEGLHVSEQGVRSRLLSLEERLGFELYRKQRGPRRATPLTPRGHDFLPRALAFLERARDLVEGAGANGFPHAPREIHVAASQYLLTYVLIDAIRRFQKAHSEVRIRLSTHNESEIGGVVAADASVAIGLAAPYDPSPELEYLHLFSTGWSLIVPPQHRLARRARVRLRELVDEPFILFERGSTGRHHVLEAFQAHALNPRVQMETTTTEIVVRMVEAGLGVSIVPLLKSGVVTRGRKVRVAALVEPIRSIRSGILTRRGEKLDPMVQSLVDFIRAGAS